MRRRAVGSLTNQSLSPILDNQMLGVSHSTLLCVPICNIQYSDQITDYIMSWLTTSGVTECLVMAGPINEGVVKQGVWGRSPPEGEGFSELKRPNWREILILHWWKSAQKRCTNTDHKLRWQNKFGYRANKRTRHYIGHCISRSKDVMDMKPAAFEREGF